MLRILLALGLMASAAQAETFILEDKSCEAVQFFGPPHDRWKFLSAREPGLVLAFQKTGERVDRRRVKFTPEGWIVGPSHCTVYLPKERGSFASGPIKLLADFEWRDAKGALHLEGYRIDMTMRLRVPNDPKSLELRTVEGFSFCRTQDTCLRMWVIDTE